MSSSPFNQSRPFRFCFHPLSVTALSLLWGGGGFCWSQSQLSPGEGRVAWTSCQLIAGQRPPCKVPAAKQQQVGVQYLAQGHFHMQLSSARGSWDFNQRPATFRSLADLLYPPLDSVSVKERIFPEPSYSNLYLSLAVMSRYTEICRVKTFQKKNTRHPEVLFCDYHLELSGDREGSAENKLTGLEV